VYQAKISLTETLAEFLAEYKTYGFKDKSTMVRTALDRLKRELETQNLKESAALYAEIYESDSELQDLTEAALDGWPA
jgi:metal-responsive CopG/Arc/MetJ family transcriptional regulator